MVCFICNLADWLRSCTTPLNHCHCPGYPILGTNAFSQAGGFFPHICIGYGMVNSFSESIDCEIP
jgi:hypothetical protein